MLWVDLFHYLLYVINPVHWVVDPFPAGRQLWREKEKKMSSNTAVNESYTCSRKTIYLLYQDEMRDRSYQQNHVTSPLLPALFTDASQTGSNLFLLIQKEFTESHNRFRRFSVLATGRTSVYAEPYNSKGRISSEKQCVRRI